MIKFDLEKVYNNCKEDQGLSDLLPYFIGLSFTIGQSWVRALPLGVAAEQSVHY